MSNQSLFERAQRTIPGGVNSPVRAFRSVGGTPRFIERAEGARVWDAEGKAYIDYVGSWGPAIAGHAHPAIVEAVREAALRGLSFGAPTEAEIEMAEALCARLPSVEMVRLVSSGTEATMSAIRLARGFTGRDAIIKFEGCYHGHADSLLVKAGSGLLTFGNPSSGGVPADFAKHTIVLDYNDLDGVEQVFRARGDEIAAIIVEPVAGNMNLIRPKPGFLEGLRALCTQYGAVLIFDEVITGFRASYGGAQGLYGVTPDLTCLGKIIGGGLPAAAFGGRAEIMDHLAPGGAVYQAGTLSGNPLAMAAGIKTMEILRRPHTYERLEELGARLGDGLLRAARDAGVDACLNRVGSAMTLFFTAGPVTDYAGAKGADTARFGAFFRAMRERGVWMPPSQFEALFVSLAHGDAEVDEIVAKAADSLRNL